jgi:hypothetical protein
MFLEVVELTYMKIFGAMVLVMWSEVEVPFKQNKSGHCWIYVESEACGLQMWRNVEVGQ